MPGPRSWWPRPSALPSSLSSSRSSASRSRGTLRPASPTRRNALRSRVREVAMRSAGHRSLSFAIVAIMLAVSCSGTGTGGGGGGQLTRVRLQLRWVAQSQFAGYYAALDKGYFKDLGLDVEIKLGGPDIVPQQVVASDAAEFGIAWVPKMLASREAGADLVNIAQVFQRSGTLEVSFKDKNITKPEDWKGKKVGTWGFGNEPELYAAMRHRAPAGRRVGRRRVRHRVGTEDARLT